MSTTIVYPTNISALRNDQLKELLLKNNIDNLTINNMTRLQRIEEVKKCKAKNSTDGVTVLLESVPLEADTKVEVLGVVAEESKPEDKPEEPASTDPTPASPLWTEFLLSKMSKDELINGHPTCDGLRRIFEIYAGEIINSDISVIQTPDMNNNNRATAQCAVTYRDHRSGLTKRISDATDVSIMNTDEMFARFPVATACTVAESRCLRKGLRLKVISREEATQPSEAQQKFADVVMSSNMLAQDSQKNVISKLCERLSINVNKLIESIPTITGKTLANISTTEAQEVMKLLNDYNRGPADGGKAIPDQIMEN